MKQLVFLVVLAFAAPALAQAPKEPAKAAAQEPAKEAEKPAAPKQAAAKQKPRRWNEDARHCLERGSNTEIIKCAEEYL